jgi:hypothetical protein
MFEVWMKIQFVSDNSCNIVNLQWPIFFNNEWKTMLGLHLVLVTLNTMFRVVPWKRVAPPTQVHSKLHIITLVGNQSVRDITEFIVLTWMHVTIELV